MGSSDWKVDGGLFNSSISELEVTFIVISYR